MTGEADPNGLTNLLRSMLVTDRGPDEREPFMWREVGQDKFYQLFMPIKGAGTSWVVTVIYKEINENTEDA